MQISKTDFKGLYLSMSAGKWHIPQLNYQQTTVFVVDLLVSIIWWPKDQGFSKVNETQVPKTVFGHLNQHIMPRVYYPINKLKSVRLVLMLFYLKIIIWKLCSTSVSSVLSSVVSNHENKHFSPKSNNIICNVTFCILFVYLIEDRM